MKSGSLNFLEPSGPVQACNGIALPLQSLNRSRTYEQTNKQTRWAGYDCYAGRWSLSFETKAQNNL